MEKLKIDVDNRSPFLKRIYLRQGDGGIQTVLINVVSGDDPVDCTGYTVKFKANLCDGKLVTGEAEPKDLANGEYTYTFKSAESSVYGDVRNAYFQLYDELGNSISGSNVLITVEKGVDITQEQAEGYVSELDKIIETAQGKADELAEFAEEEKGKITDEVTDVSEFAESQKGLMTEAVTDVQTFAESEKNDITSIKNDVSGFADEQKATMADKTGEVDNYGDIQKVAMLNKRLEIEQTGNQEKAKILAVLPDVESSIAEQTEQIADLQEALSDVSLHQAWANSPDGTVDFTTVYPGENLINGSYDSSWSFSPNAGGSIQKVTMDSGEVALHVIGTNAGSGFYAWFTLPSGNNTTSIEVKGTGKINLLGWQGIGYSKNIIPTSDWQRISITNSFDGKANVFVLYGIMDVYVRFLKIEKGTIATPWYPSPKDDPINCYPKYVGFGIKNSDEYQDYRWILNPKWAMANALYGTEMTTLKTQLSDMQTWIQAHS